METKPFIPYNTSLKDYGKINRNQRNMKKTEWIFRNLVLKWDKTWYRFLRQKLIWSFILDFYCSQLKLCIEIDGWYHNDTQDQDEDREIKLLEFWIKTIRYTNDEIEKNLNGVIEDLQEKLKERHWIGIDFD